MCIDVNDEALSAETTSKINSLLLLPLLQVGVEAAPMLGVRASPSGRYVLVLLRAAPSEIWTVSSCAHFESTRRSVPRPPCQAVRSGAAAGGALRHLDGELSSHCVNAHKDYRKTAVDGGACWCCSGRSSPLSEG